DEPVPTDEPKAEPTDEPVPTNEPTAEPTVDPAPTSEPTPTTEPRETLEPTAEATGEPTPLPTATEAAIEPQAPSVDPSETPAQETVSGPFRIALEGAAAGEDVTTALPEIQPVTYGEWVVLSVYAVNESDTEQVFDMSQFSLLADGEVILLDTGSGWVNGLLGNTPAYSNTDSVLWAAGEGHQFALTFLAPIDATTLTLLIGDQSVDLSGTLTTENPISGGTEAPVAPDAIEGTVVDVLDGETIVVDIDGIEQNVTYLGVEAPRGDDCFASEATAANSALVTGQNVRLERQSTNTDAQGNWVRDVWVATESGGFTLVSQALVRDGAVNASISEPNTRFASWLTTSEASARGEGAGLWSACGAAGESGEQATLSSSAVIRPQLAFQ
ncbi:MAG: thermonuclease family protein, partial [Thermomicrobiales bacterium]